MSESAKTYAPHGKFVQLVPITVTNWASFCPVGTNPIALR